MSIEIDLNRIATALEQMLLRMPVASVSTVPAAVPVKEAKKSKETAPAPVAVAEAEVDPFSHDAEVVPTFDELSTLLKEHSIKLGTKVTIALIKKHGANAVTPKLNTIPEANFKACYDEATADLKKLEGKK